MLLVSLGFLRLSILNLAFFLKRLLENQNYTRKYTHLSCVVEMLRTELKKRQRTYKISEKLDVLIRYNADDKLGFLKLSREVEKINKPEA